MQRNAPYCPEARQASLHKHTFRQALSLIFDRRESLRTAQPYSASIIANGNNFVYNQGVLCYSSGNNIRLLDVHQQAREEKVIDGQIFGFKLRPQPNAEEGVSDDVAPILSLLGYADEILVILSQCANLAGSWLFALDVRDRLTPLNTRPNQKGRVLLRRRLTSTTKLFVRHNSSYLYLGTHSAQNSQGHHEWQIQGFSLDTGQPVNPKPVQLNNFAGAEIGVTAAFAIHEGSFYAVTNQNLFETEEVDWTSFYLFIKFSLGSDDPDIRLWEIWRRQHREGPINDAWTDLTVRTDEQGNDLTIMECRKEWRGGGRVCTRTYYQSSFPDASSLDDDIPRSMRNLLPPNDPLIPTLDEESKPNYVPEEIRAARTFHREYDNDDEKTTDFSHDYIRAKTKHHSYSPEALSFVDLVSDSITIPGFSRQRDRIRLRVASRLAMSPLTPASEALEGLSKFEVRPKQLDSRGDAIRGSEEDFHPTKIYPLWPPSNACHELQDVLCPGGRAGTVQAASDNHALIYQAGTTNAGSDGERAIIMINFDPRWGRGVFPKIKIVTNADWCEKDMQFIIESPEMSRPQTALKRREFSASTGDETAEPQSPIPPKKQKLKGPVASSSSGSVPAESTSTAATAKPRLLWKEKAKYWTINRGYYFPRAALKGLG